jgi:membrane protein
MRLGECWQVGVAAGRAWMDDNAPRMGAALAYYAAFSLAPLLLIAVGLAALVFGDRAAQGGIVHEIESTVGPSAALAIQDLLRHAAQSGGGGLATVVGLAVLLFAASGVFVELRSDLNTIWKVPAAQTSGLWAWVRDRLLSFLAVCGLGLLLLGSLVVSTLLSTVGAAVERLGLPGGAWPWRGIDLVLAFSLVLLLFALVYKMLPDRHIPWGDVWAGAAVAAVLFSLGKYLIGLYLAKLSPASAFGAAGSLAVVLLWVYYSAQILLYGAEFARAVAERSGCLSARPA